MTTNSETIVMPFFRRECSRCGYCCALSPCPVGKALSGVEAGTCPFLEIGSDKATCMVMLWKPSVALTMGQGMGCCMKARLLNTQTLETMDFCDLIPEDKRKLAMHLYHKQKEAARDAAGQPPHEEGNVRTHSMFQSTPPERGAIPG